MIYTSLKKLTKIMILVRIFINLSDVDKEKNEEMYWEKEQEVEGSNLLLGLASWKSNFGIEKGKKFIHQRV